MCVCVRSTEWQTPDIRPRDRPEIALNNDDVDDRSSATEDSSGLLLRRQSYQPEVSMMNDSSAAILSVIMADEERHFTRARICSTTNPRYMF